MVLAQTSSIEGGANLSDYSNITNPEKPKEPEEPEEPEEPKEPEEPEEPEEPIKREWIIAKDISIKGTGHIQGLSAKADSSGIWKNNMFILGTVGEKRRLEGFTLHLDGAPSDMLLVYRAHIQTDGDKPDEEDDGDTICKDNLGKLWQKEGQYLGTKGDKKRVEGIELKLINKNTGKEYEGYKILYQVHMQEYGWGINDIKMTLKMIES